VGWSLLGLASGGVEMGVEVLGRDADLTTTNPALQVKFSEVSVGEEDEPNYRQTLS
jgi:hypothetical protein